jgi:hypothetical protein
MGKIVCNCGNVISTSVFPNPDGVLLISEVNFDKVEEDSETKDRSQIFDELHDRSARVYKCRDCQRLIVFWDRSRNETITYIPEQESRSSVPP